MHLLPYLCVDCDISLSFGEIFVTSSINSHKGSVLFLMGVYITHTPGSAWVDNLHHRYMYMHNAYISMCDFFLYKLYISWWK